MFILMENIFFLDQDLGLQASERIMSSSDPLGLLRDISQNFPLIAGSLSRLKVEADTRQNIDNNQGALQYHRFDDSFLYLNGHLLDIPTLSPFTYVNPYVDVDERLNMCQINNRYHCCIQFI